MLSRAKTYLHEIQFLRTLCATRYDAFRLSHALIRFHTSNAFKWRRSSHPRKYRLTLLGRPHDVWLRTMGGDLFVLSEVFGTRCYTLPANMLGSTKLIVDLGGNVGMTSLFLAAQAPDAAIISVEPEPGNAQVLRRNLACLPRAQVVEAAAAGESGTLTFDNARHDWGGRLAKDGNIKVRAISVADLLAQYAPTGTIDVLKIDIEGAERFVLDGPMPWLDRVRCIMIETHPPYTFEDFTKAVAPRGFVTYRRGEGGFGMETAIRKEAGV